MATLENIQGSSLVPSVSEALGTLRSAFGTPEIREDRRRKIAAEDAAIKRQKDIEEQLGKVLPDPARPGAKRTVDQDALVKLMGLGPKGVAAARNALGVIAAGDERQKEVFRVATERGARQADFVLKQKTFGGKQAALQTLASEAAARGEPLERMQELMNMGEGELDLELQRMKVMATPLATLLKPVERFEPVRDAAGNVIAQRSTTTGKEIAPGRREIKGRTEAAKARLDFKDGLITAAERNTIINTPQKFQSTVGKLIGDKKIVDATFGKDSEQAKAINETIKSESKGEAAKLTDIAGQRKEFTKLSGDFIKLSGAVGKMRQLSATPSPAGDLGMVFSFMKVLDPPSTVREGEQATARNAAGVPEVVQNAWNKLITGESLTPKQRADFMSTAEDLLSSEINRQLRLEDSFSALATSANIDPGKVVIDFLGPDRPDAITDEGGTGVTIRFDAQGNIIQ